MNAPHRPAPPNAPRHASYALLGLTDSLCPECMRVVRAKILVRGRRVYFRKRCPEHGEREDFVSSDVDWWDRGEARAPAVLPAQRSTDVRRGCPHDCGLCPDHEQHTCVGLVELTSQCNLSCPMCFASSGPGGEHLSKEDVLRALDLLVACEGRAEICQLSGGEPTLHPQFRDIVDAALQRPIDYVMVNTNGIRLAKEESLAAFLGRRRERVEVYFQWDGDAPRAVRALRGEDVIDVKRRALDRLARHDVNVTLVSTLHAPLPDGFYERLLGEALQRDNVTGLSLQPATYSGRHVLPETLEQRVTFPDVIRGLAAASAGRFAETDFVPLPCAHANCHQILLAARDGGRLAPLTRHPGALDNLDLLAGGISFTRQRAGDLVRQFLARGAGCGSDCGCAPAERAALPVLDPAGGGAAASPAADPPLLREFFARVLAGSAGARDLFRVTITSFLDAYNFDVRQLMKCCTHHVLPSGHVIPFCAYNTLYRPGHLPLPPIAEPVAAADSAAGESRG